MKNLSKNSRLAITASLLVFAFLFGRYTNMDLSSQQNNLYSSVDALQHSEVPTVSQTIKHTAQVAPTLTPTLLPTPFAEKTDTIRTQQNNEVSITKGITVYITRTGAKYHQDGCRYLSRSQIPISLSNAKQGYDPCKVCHPPY